MAGEIYNCDCLEGMGNLESDSIDLVVTDPPYGYSFMGKDWDKAVPPVDVWRECLRVLKPGAFCLVMSAPRQDVLSHMIVNLGDAGFNTAFTSIYWTYASGFPKAMNIGKAIDKRNGRTSKDFYKFAEYLKEKRESKGLTKAMVDKACNIKSSCYIWEGDKTGQIQVPTMKSYLIIKTLLDLDDRFDELIEREEAEREIIGQKDVGIKNGSCNGSHEYGLTKSEVDITKPATNEAQKYDGSYAGFQPKPAVEIVIVAMKPLNEKTYVDQVLGNGKGVVWFDDCRIPYDGKQPGGSGLPGNDITDMKSRVNGNGGNITPLNGRFPANLLCCDDVLNDGNDRKSGEYGYNYHANDSTIYGEYQGTKGKAPSRYGDSGSFSRYFDLDAWFHQLTLNLPDDVKKTYPFLLVPKASKSEKNKGCEGLEEKEAYNLGHKTNPGRKAPKRSLPRSNHHPTVKPIKLGTYLITLTTRPGDTILDPYAGSGTFLISAKISNRNYIGFDLESEYCNIAEHRLNAWEPMKEEKKQSDLFAFIESK